nr:wiskott-Aldrich syndrome protein-like [Equus asinus]
MPTQRGRASPTWSRAPGLRGPPLPLGRGRGSWRSARCRVPGARWLPPVRAGCPPPAACRPAPRPPRSRPLFPARPPAGALSPRGESGRRRAAQRRGAPARPERPGTAHSAPCRPPPAQARGAPGPPEDHEEPLATETEARVLSGGSPEDRPLMPTLWGGNIEASLLKKKAQ